MLIFYIYHLKTWIPVFWVANKNDHFNHRNSLSLSHLPLLLAFLHSLSTSLRVHAIMCSIHFDCQQLDSWMMNFGPNYFPPNAGPMIWTASLRVVCLFGCGMIYFFSYKGHLQLGYHAKLHDWYLLTTSIHCNRAISQSKIEVGVCGECTTRCELGCSSNCKGVPTQLKINLHPYCHLWF